MLLYLFVKLRRGTAIYGNSLTITFCHCSFNDNLPLFSLFACVAVRADRMRGGRNKFGPMYKRDRARKLQILRQRQLALQAIRGSIGGGSSSSGTGYPPYTNMHIKQEIQIPQVWLMTLNNRLS